MLNIFTSEAEFYPEKGRWGYNVYEIIDGERILRVVSSARWVESIIATLHGIKEASRVRYAVDKRLAGRIAA